MVLYIYILYGDTAHENTDTDRSWSNQMGETSRETYEEHWEEDPGEILGDDGDTRLFVEPTVSCKTDRRYRICTKSVDVCLSDNE